MAQYHNANAGGVDTEPAMQDIPREQWGEFLDRFSRDNADVSITAELQAPDAGRHELARDIPLVGITAEINEEAAPNSIEVILGDDPQRYMSHTVAEPSRVCARSDGGVHILEIYSDRTGETLVLRWSR